ncbi:MAG TPA: glutamate--tRNA ligase [Candidatus Portnoybacteria bacterium]|jgi:nondiscriminating glutamyl-tRNA synthetase|nr:glutamate--tRNA ligase [Candidatus Portnoybacteria bacterium]MDD5752209.1 glutamate--tRNA ligase [Candidatus Portnoybacteria bacterium]HNU96941.1 glutamate--tRNA ligase [Candidatus Portnoybacteria bacterium]HOZ16575.1 glutamate--tRNA ligase [Candidatus Portnoybacteria bacterium]HPH52202.1 glutamate--tRNA ligase [Candidatus Portnoybacteria bacterium]
MFKNSKVRVRFAPSPTGFLHIGSLRTVLLDYLFSKKEKGDFILRIEDTDQERFTEGAIESLLKTLKTFKIKFDEGPFYQSKRLDIYNKHAEQLLKEEKAYYCFCTKERLEKMREEQIANKQAPMYDQHCRNLDKKTIEENLKNKAPYTIRMKVPAGETIKFHDLLHGEIEFKTDLIDDQILIKSDGFPTYHFAVVIDDHLMKISHAMRGEEWISSTPKHLLLYKYLNWKPPIFIHLSLMLNKNGGKLSKRKGDVAVESFLENGYLPEALINFIGLTILSVKDKEKEILSLNDLIKMFNWNKVHKNPAILDIDKLDWINSQYIKQIPIKELTKLCLPYLPKDSDLNEKTIEKIIKLEQPRMNKLSDIGESSDFFFKELDYNKDLLTWPPALRGQRPGEKDAPKEKTLESLNKTYSILCDVKDGSFGAEKLKQILMPEAEKFINSEGKIDRGQLLWPMRVALSGKEKSPGPFEIAEILGKTETLKRIQKAINRLK